MTEYLIFTLTAALASMGDLAGHERRGTLMWPGRSAILGLCAAALGIRRDDAEALAALEPLRVAVATFDYGAPLRDYHTVQTVPTAAVKRPDSRPVAIAAARDRLNTVITLRDYRSNALHGVALWGAPLTRLAAALEEPVFTLYFGRKSCPLSAPLAPRIVAAACPVEALAGLRLPPWRTGSVAKVLASDADSGVDDDATGRVERRQDVALDRSRWHFTSREVVVHGVEITGDGS